MDSFSVLYSPIGTHINGPGTCNWYSEVNDAESDVKHKVGKNIMWDPLIDNPDHLRYLIKKEHRSLTGNNALCA